MKSFKKFVAESIEQVELDEQAMTFQNAEKLKNKHLATMDHHKKSGNSKGYTAHSMVVRKFEDAYDRHGTGVIPAGRILSASQKAFKDHPHSGMKESVELDEKLKASDDMGTWVKDFQDSDAPQFKGKSQKERQKMAIAAKLAAERNEEVNESNDMKMVRIGQKMLDLAPKEKNDMISNAYSKLGDALTRYGTSFGPKSVKDLEKSTGLSQRIIMDLIKKAQQ